MSDRGRRLSGESRTLTSIAALVLIGVDVLAPCAISHSMQVWSPDNRDGSYTNPIIFGDYSDPDAIRVGDDFYMTASRHRKPDVGRVYPIASPQTSDEFASKPLGLQWQWQANYQTHWMSLKARAGWLRLNGEAGSDSAKNLWGASNALLQKLPAPEFTVTTKIDCGQLGRNQRAGLIVMGMDYSYIAVERDTSGFHLAKYVCFDASNGKTKTREAESALRGATAVLRVRVSSGALCEFSFSADGHAFTPIGFRFKAREGRWVGGKVGLFCLGAGARTRGHADFDWFRVVL